MVVKDQGLGFVVIGAQKAGTTTLFHLLREHPELWLPPSKEASFFNRPELYRRGPRHLMETFFAGAPSEKLLGKVSPEYMCHPDVAGRLYDAFPEAKIIAILRDPIERAYSHYRMMVRRGEEERSFQDAIGAQLGEGQLVEARRSRSGTETYVAWGEYGRILGDYAATFPLENILILSTVELETTPAAVVEMTHQFLAVPHVVPANAGKRYHVGGTRQRIPGLQKRAESRVILRRAWHLLPQRHRDLIFFRFDQWNVRRSKDDDGPIPLYGPERERLSHHFRHDACLLARVTDLRIPSAFEE